MYGQGIYRWPDGRKNDLPHEYGTLLDNEGIGYKGEWQEGKNHGYGVLMFTDGTVYEGEMVEDMHHCQGVLRHANGGSYERHGHG